MMTYASSWVFVAVKDVLELSNASSAKWKVRFCIFLFSCSSSQRTFVFGTTGVTDIATDVEAKTVIVQADASVKPEEMLGKLQKVCFTASTNVYGSPRFFAFQWSEVSGKSVALA